MSLRLLAWTFSRAPNIDVGLLTHAHVSPTFRGLFAAFPHGSMLADASTKESPLPVRVHRLGDSGIFHGALPYDELFRRYHQLAVQFGIMSDVLGDPKGTIASARVAVREYVKTRRTFDLVL